MPTMLQSGSRAWLETSMEFGWAWLSTRILAALSALNGQPVSIGRYDCGRAGVSAITDARRPRCCGCTASLALTGHLHHSIHQLADAFINLRNPLRRHVRRSGNDAVSLIHADLVG